MILGISGSHGTGKSTITNALKEWIQVDESQLSRSAQKALGWDKLSIAGESIENMWALQDAIFEAMIQRDWRLNLMPEFVATERTPADLWAYTVMWCKRLGIDHKVDERAQEYFRKCKTASKLYDAFIIVPICTAIPFEVDPNRADLQSREEVSELIQDFLEEDTEKCHTIFSTGKQERAEEAIRFLKTRT